MNSFDFICVEDYEIFEGHIDDELLAEIMSE
jgi:hypothetical protein